VGQVATGLEGTRRAATAARIYDYCLGGWHNFPADQEAAKVIIAQNPNVPAIARANRAFLGRVVRHLARAGVRQFLDIGSGIPTVRNVHEVAQAVIEDARVVYADIDVVAVAESLELLDGNPHATAIRGDLCQPADILGHAKVKQLLDFRQPIGLLLVGVLYFVSDDDAAYRSVRELVDALPQGSYLAISHVTTEERSFSVEDEQVVEMIYRSRTSTPLRLRTRAEIQRFFDRLDVVEPGLVWLPEWNPQDDDPRDFADDPRGSATLGALARIRPPEPGQ
jgi:hypothetical protein